LASQFEQDLDLFFLPEKIISLSKVITIKALYFKMKKLIFLFIPMLLLLNSCNPSKVEEGEIEYVVTYPNLEITGFMLAILPENMTITFKGTKMKASFESGSFFTTEIISDEANKSVEMRLNFGDIQIYSVLDENEIQEMISSQPRYTITDLGKQDSVSGMYSSSYSVTSKTDVKRRETAWFTEDLSLENPYWFTSYAAIKGLPVVYDAERYGVMMHLVATKLTKREVLPAEFERDPVLKKVSFEEYEAEVQELFDTLME
jgi:hypothetical protein